MSSSEPEARRGALPPPEVTDGAAWLRAARAGAGTPRAWPALRRALLLEEPGALGVAAELAPALTPEEGAALLAVLADVGPWSAALDACRRASGVARAMGATPAEARAPGAVTPPDWAALFAALRPLAAAVGDLDPPLDAAAWQRETAGPLCVVVAGEFNAGKSTLINALVGAPVCAVGLRPTTASAHRITWGEDAVARVLTPQRERVVTLPRLPAVLAEVGTRSSVTVWVPSPALDGLDLIDTPGLNALSGGPTAEAGARDPRLAVHELAEDAHAVLWLLDATQPLKASEVGALETVTALGLPLLVAVSRVDRLSDDAARARVLAFVTATLAERGVALRVPPLAVGFPRGAPALGVEALHTALRERLRPERPALIVAAQRARLRRRLERWRPRLAAPAVSAPDQPPAALAWLAALQGLGEGR